MATLVLVHGAWGGGWCWRDAARLLRARGHEVYAPTLGGLAERATVPPDLVSLSTHIAEIAGLLAFEDLRDAVLVGHSYAGMVITGAADRAPDRVGGLVYFDAFLPESGQSLFDIAAPANAERHRAAAAAHDGGHSVPTPATPRTPPGPGVIDEAPYTPQPIKTMSEPWTSVRETQTWPPRHFILCTAHKTSTFPTHRRALAPSPGLDDERTRRLSRCDLRPARAHGRGHRGWRSRRWGSRKAGLLAPTSHG